MNQYQRTTRNVYNANAVLTAEAGIEQSITALNDDNDFVGFTTETEFFNDPIQGRGTYQTEIATGAGQERTMISTGRVYRFGNGGALVSKRAIKVTMVGTTSSGYSVYTGVGGLVLGGTANITNSEIFINGKLEMSGNANIGTYNGPVNVNIANIACPLGGGASYPMVCQDDAIIAGSNNNIYGTVCATNQGPNDAVQPGDGGEGLILPCVASPQDMPEYDRAAHIASMTTTGTDTSSTYNCAGNSTGTKNWPANLTLTGNVTIGANCTINLNGNVYITGNFMLSGNAKMQVSDSVGANRPIIVVDGTITVGSAARIFPNSQGTGAHFYSFKSNAPCGSACTDITGDDLENTVDYETITISGAVNLPGIIFQAYWGLIDVAGSGNIGAALGQTVDLQGTGNITFGTQVSSGETTWTIRSYQQYFD
jgi:hypothetical protein